jgi:hypothetical protein
MKTFSSKSSFSKFFKTGHIRFIVRFAICYYIKSTASSKEMNSWVGPRWFPESELCFWIFSSRVARKPRAGSTIVSYNARVVIIYNPMVSLMHIERKNNFFCIDKRELTSLLQRWRCRTKFRSSRIWSRSQSFDMGIYNYNAKKIGMLLVESIWKLISFWRHVFSQKYTCLQKNGGK